MTPTAARTWASQTARSRRDDLPRCPLRGMRKRTRTPLPFPLTYLPGGGLRFLPHGVAFFPILSRSTNDALLPHIITSRIIFDYRSLFSIFPLLASLSRSRNLVFSCPSAWKKMRKKISLVTDFNIPLRERDALITLSTTTTTKPDAIRTRQGRWFASASQYLRVFGFLLSSFYVTASVATQ